MALSRPEANKEIGDLMKLTALQEEHVSLLAAFCTCVLHDDGARPDA